MEAPYLQKVHQQYKNQGGMVIGVALKGDEIDSLQEFRKRHKVTYPITYDVNGRVYENFDLTIPSSVVVDRQGIIRLLEDGFQPKKFAAAKQRFAALVKNSPASKSSSKQARPTKTQSVQKPVPAQGSKPGSKNKKRAR